MGKKKIKRRSQVKMKWHFIFLLFLLSCRSTKTLQINASADNKISGTEFYHIAAGYNWHQRDSFALQEILSGNIPSFLKKFVRINVSITDSSTNRKISAYYFAAPDYLAIGNNGDWARIPLTPMTAQVICDSFNCFLPTPKMVDDIYRSATVKLEPVPMFAYRDSTVTMWQHHLIIEGQRNNRSGLIAGIKKDVVISGNILKDIKPNRVAIYGWHRLNGKAIQPLYTGHVNWYVDYSHGIRLVYRRIYVEGKEMDYTDVLKHPVYQKLLCDGDCGFYRY